MPKFLRRRRSQRGASAVGYALVLATFAVASSSIAGAVGDNATDDLADRGDRIGNPDQFVAPVVDPGDDGGSGGDDELPPPPTSTTVAISGLIGETSIGGGNKWTASVTVSVGAVPGAIPTGGAVVSGIWSEGSVATSCSTDSSGSCVVTQSGLKMVGGGAVLETTFTVTDVAGSDLVYDAAENDPDPAELTLYKP